MKTDMEQKLKNDFPQMIRTHPGVLSAYVFGSMAVGVERMHSDVDIAVRMDRRLQPGEMFDLRLKLIEALEDLMGRSVDVIVLNTASLKMIHQIMKTGRMPYVTDPKEETAFRLQKQKEYFDFQYYMEDDRKALKSFYGS